MLRSLSSAGALAAALSTLSSLPAPSAAAPLAAGEIRARSAGGEFRGYGATRRSALEDVIWRFRPDGSLSSVSQIRRRAAMASQFEEYNDTGTWRIEGDRLCVEFRSVHRDMSGCYGVDGGAGEQVRLVGPVQLQGTLSR